MKFDADVLDIFDVDFTLIGLRSISPHGGCGGEKKMGKGERKIKEQRGRER